MVIRRVPYESWEQSTLIQWWHSGGRQSLGLPEQALLYSIPNGACKSPAAAQQFKREGLLAGVPDLFLAWPSGGRHGLYIEMKRRAGGRVSPEQTETMAALSAAGYSCAVCHGWNEAASAIATYIHGGSHG